MKREEPTGWNLLDGLLDRATLLGFLIGVLVAALFFFLIRLLGTQ